jgi:hypothetical protein
LLAVVETESIIKKMEIEHSTSNPGYYFVRTSVSADCQETQTSLPIRIEAAVPLSRFLTSAIICSPAMFYKNTWLVLP